MIVIGLIVVLLAGLILFAFVVLSTKASSFTPTDYNPALVTNKWSEITTNLHNQNSNNLKNCLIEADKLLDYVMKGKGYRGETMADRLKIAQSQMRDRESVWQAHKLRNAIVHELHYDIVPAQIQQAVRALGQGIKDLGGQL